MDEMLAEWQQNSKDLFSKYHFSEQYRAMKEELARDHDEIFNEMRSSVIEARGAAIGWQLQEQHHVFVWDSVSAPQILRPEDGEKVNWQKEGF